MLSEPALLSLSLVFWVLPLAAVELSRLPGLEERPATPPLAGLDTQALALLRGGPHAVVEAALVSLVRRGLLVTAADGGLLLCDSGYRERSPRPSSRPLERHVLDVVAQEPGLAVGALVARAQEAVEVEALEARLSARGLVLDEAEVALRRQLAQLSSMVGLVLGGAALGSAWGTGRWLPSVAALSVIILVVVLVLAAGRTSLAKRRPLSASGLALLRSLDAKHHLRRRTERRYYRLRAEELAFAYAALGDEILSGAEAGLAWSRGVAGRRGRAGRGRGRRGQRVRSGGSGSCSRRRRLGRSRRW